MAVLVDLARQPKGLVTREDLLDRVWDGAFVGDHVVSHAIWDLRQALGDDPKKPTFIETVPRRGYRLLVAPDGVEEEARKRSPLHWVAALLVALLLSAFWLRWSERSGHAPLGLRFSQLTATEGPELDPALSPRGEMVAFAGLAEEGFDVFLLLPGSGSPTNLTSAFPADDYAPAFSPRGDLLAFVSDREEPGIYVMDLSGGGQHRVTGPGFDPAWSPDGRRIVFSQESGEYPWGRYRDSDLQVVEVATGEVRSLGIVDGVQPAWSPGGHRIAYWSNDHGQRDLWTVRPDGDGARPVTRDQPVDWSPVWSPDGRFLYFLSDREGSPDVWRIAIEEVTGRPLGGPEPVTRSGGAEIWRLAIAADGSRMVYSVVSRKVNLQRLDFDPEAAATVGEPVWITRGSVPVKSPAVSPDGEWVAFVEGEVGDLAVVRVDGSELRRLTDDAFKYVWPRWSPDGARIAFASNRSGSYEIWTIAPDGSDLRQLTDLPELTLNAPVWSPDGERIALSSNTTRRSYLIATDLPRHEQEIEQLPWAGRGVGFVAWSWSPDGRKLAGILWDEESLGPELAIYHLETGRYEELPTRGTEPCWLADSRRLLILQKDPFRFVLLDAPMGREKIIHVFDDSASPQGYWLPADDRFLVFPHGRFESDLWLAELSP